MKGLIFNLLADLARRAGCEDDAWEVALAVSEEVTEELALEDDDELMLGLITEECLHGGADFTFRWLVRSGTAFCEDDWADLAETPPKAFGPRASERPPALFPDWSDPSRRRPNKT
jgi:hypothetical protein